MNRRGLLKGAASTLLLPCLSGLTDAPVRAGGPSSARAPTRVRPSDPDWPSAAQWEELRNRVNGNLIEIHSPLHVCEEAPSGAACDHLFKELKNPYFIGDHVALTQTLGWVDALDRCSPSVYAVAADKRRTWSPRSISRATTNLRLVVKGGGHSYLGTSNAPDSLMIWTRAMNDITMHDDFVAQGCERMLRRNRRSRSAPARSGCTPTTQSPPRAAAMCKAAVAARSAWPALFKAAASAAIRRIMAPPRRACSRPRSSPRTERCGSPMPARIRICSGRLKGGGGGSLGVVTRMTLRTARAARPFRCGARDDRCCLRCRLSPADRALCEFLCRKPFQFPLG